MFGDIIQPTHLLFILVIALLVLGPKRLPEVGRSLGRGIRDFRQGIQGVEAEARGVFHDALDEPEQPASEQGEAAAAVADSAPVADPVTPAQGAPPAQTASATEPAPVAQPVASVAATRPAPRVAQLAAEPDPDDYAD